MEIRSLDKFNGMPGSEILKGKRRGENSSWFCKH